MFTQFHAIAAAYKLRPNLSTGLPVLAQPPSEAPCHFQLFASGNPWISGKQRRDDHHVYTRSHSGQVNLPPQKIAEIPLSRITGVLAAFVGPRFCSSVKGLVRWCRRA